MIEVGKFHPAGGSARKNQGFDVSEDELMCSIVMQFNLIDGVRSFQVKTEPRVKARKFHYLIQIEFNEQSVACRRVRPVAKKEK